MPVSPVLAENGKDNEWVRQDDSGDLLASQSTQRGKLLSH